MKKITNPSSLLALFLLFTCTLQSQQDKRVLHSNTGSLGHQGSQAAAAKRAVLGNCTDKSNYVGNNDANWVQMGGSGNAITGLFQVFDNYVGSVIGVEFDAAKSATIAG